MRRFLYDTAVFVYALGGDHPYRGPCQRLLALAGSERLVGEASVELVHVFVLVRARRTGDRAAAVAQGMDIADLCVLHEVREGDLRLALRLFAGQQRLDVRDALFAATALNRGIDAVVSPDRAFDAVGGLERVDPADAESRLS